MINYLKVFSALFMFFSVVMFFEGLWFMMTDFSLMVEWELFSLNSSMIVMAVLLDWIALIFMGLVLFISSLVMFYSNGYMMGDMSLNRFVALVCLFVFSMILLIVSPNLISILLGWDGLGLVSYCLVIYYQNNKSANAGMLTALTNRVGDVFILLTISWLLSCGSWNYIYYYDYFVNFYGYNCICYLVLLAGMTKSAQIPFSAWLPAAMAAPTPVSALVHSSTLVTAGVYLMIRFSPMIYVGGGNYFLLFIGCLTMFMSGLVANYEFDLSKIIALSTLSQLGLMVGSLAMGYPMVSFFHLLTHALFKSLLFLCAGCYIHVLLDYQDIRYMGSLGLMMPYTSACFHISMLSLCGFPFLSGFYSKDLILELCSLGQLNYFIYVLFYVSTGLTVMYSVRLLYYSLLSPFSFNVLRDLSGLSLNMNLGMIVLLFAAIIGGSFLSWCIFPIPSCIYLPLDLSMMVVLSVVVGAYIGYLILFGGFTLNVSYGCFWFHNFYSSMWFMPLISVRSISLLSLSLGGRALFFLDYGWLEYYGAQGLYNFMLYYIRQYLYLLDYNFKTYIMLFSFFLVIFMCYVIFL
uniref:NADH-ubiquinone oxidoreductase chain 5 n=1 Tax=Paragavialidium sichuanense TaxID=2793213 RepID=A0A7T0ND26_9ORTH|nr:NADH dehydrogenase subunit 5 [Paragavialidium sichuanense]